MTLPAGSATLSEFASCAPGIRHSVLFLEVFPILRSF
jgi:hypothetical protein